MQAKPISSGLEIEIKPNILAAHPNWRSYPINTILVYSAFSGGPNASHWRSNFIFTHPMGSPEMKSVKFDPTMMEIDAPTNYSSIMSVSLVPYVGTTQARSKEYPVKLTNSIEVGKFLDLLNVDWDLLAYRPTKGSKGCLYWHYALISVLEEEGYVAPGTTRAFILWLKDARAESKERLHDPDSIGVSDIEKDPTVRGIFKPAVQARIKEPNSWL